MSSAGDTAPQAQTMTVVVRDSAQWGPGLVTVTIPVICPRGGTRANVGWYRGCEDGEWYSVNTWECSCGTVDLYAAVLREAKDFEVAEHAAWLERSMAAAAAEHPAGAGPQPQDGLCLP